MTEMKGAGGVGADKLQEYSFISPGLAAAIVFTEMENFGQFAVPLSPPDGEIDKTGAGDFRLVKEVFIIPHMFKDDARNLPRISFLPGRKRHGEVGCKMTVFGILGHLYDVVGDGSFLKGAAFKAPGKGSFQYFIDPVFHGE